MFRKMSLGGYQHLGECLALAGCPKKQAARFYRSPVLLELLTLPPQPKGCCEANRLNDR